MLDGTNFEENRDYLVRGELVSEVNARAHFLEKAKELGLCDQAQKQLVEQSLLQAVNLAKAFKRQVKIPMRNHIEIGPLKPLKMQHQSGGIHSVSDGERETYRQAQIARQQEMREKALIPQARAA
ncbi:MAG: hypothetical protein AAF988_00235 [Pseudomonadota bacterium]